MLVRMIGGDLVSISPLRDAPPRPTLPSPPSNTPGRSPPGPCPVPCPQHTHTPPLLGPTTRSQKESDSSSRPDRVQGTRPSPAGTTQADKWPPQRTSEGGTAGSQKHRWPDARATQHPRRPRGRGKQRGTLPIRWRICEDGQCPVLGREGMGTRDSHVLWVKV